jgi:hypothetical protein
MMFVAVSLRIMYIFTVILHRKTKLLYSFFVVVYDVHLCDR